MIRKNRVKGSRSRVPTAATTGALPDDDDDDDHASDATDPPVIVERPDGYHWVTQDGRLEFGPYEDLASAQRDSQASDVTSEEALAPNEALHTVEREMDLPDWIDPQTGALAEDGSAPHLNEE